MDRIIVYVSYDQYEYRNYYHLMNNDDILIEYRSEDELDILFQSIKENKGSANSIEIYIAQDKNALEWDYSGEFQKHHIDLHKKENCDEERVYKIINEVQKKESEKISILFCGEGVFRSDKCGRDEPNREDEEIQKPDGEEMTELARIIKEKYERMSRRDKF